MNEVTRQTVLRSMGIPVWYARCALPGAKPSQSVDFTGFTKRAAQAEKQPSIDRADADLSAKRIASLVARPSVCAIGKDGSLLTAAKQEAKVSLVDSPVVDSPQLSAFSVLVDNEVPEVSVRVYRLNHFIVVNTANSETDSHREFALLSNLGSALAGMDNTVEELCEFEWPVFGNKGLLGQSNSMAREILLKVMHPYLVNARGLIWMGRLSLLNIGVQGDIVPWSAVSAGSDSENLPTVSTWSLGELLIEPQRKRELWRHIRILVNAC